MVILDGRRLSNYYAVNMKSSCTGISLCILSTNEINMSHYEEMAEERGKKNATRLSILYFLKEGNE